MKADQQVCRVLIAGDLCPQGRFESNFRKDSPANPLEPISSFIRQYDLSIVNLECPLTEKRDPILKGGPHLWASPECAAGIRSAGFQVASLANNHILDMGGKGLESTLNAVHAAGMKHVGAGMDLEEANRPLVVEVKSRRVAVFAFAENEFASATRNSPGACPLDDLENIARIRDARKEHDVVLVILHGGNEGYPLPNPALVKRCRHYVKAGASAVVCHHSHTPTGYEQYAGAPIFYGTGNLYFDWPDAHAEDWFEGYMVGLEIHADGSVDGTIHPYRQARDGKEVRLMSAEDARKFQERIDGFSKTIQNAEALTAQWKAFCSSVRLEYLGNLLASNRVEQRLWEMNILRPAWVQKRLSTVYLDMIRCESLREVLLEILSTEHERASKSR